MSVEIEALVNWFEEEKRELPWRKNVSAYGVWVSEIMLQQTQASVVIPYFEKWMALFPTVRSLAEASLDLIMKTWEGLGYYSRARHLHEGAKWILSNHQGVIPDSEEELKKIKGLGPYTIGALLSFAFHRKAAAVDGNVMRVISRLFLIEDPIDQQITQKRIRECTQSILPEKKPWVAMEALIELGAQVCKKEPLCLSCPLSSSCLAYQRGKAKELPKKKNKTSYESIRRFVAVIQCDNEFLIRKEQPGNVMAGLYQFPYFDFQKLSISKWQQKLEMFIKGSLFFENHLLEIKHTFTRYRAQLFPTHWKSTTKAEIESYEWVSWEKMQRLAFSSGHRQILKQLEQ